ncbi:hypothetical protein Fuma_01631 [Fuerstiella marisgermanici]|uniref:Uncharacterized protein n=1 Tax=Fuerstiella marisgermanici TaxID=1891926 RepID=A0A1P8WDC5_9PLAN|nr:hypothetical protein Fuma_01631 [Fuerstiella marisgermanici]
MKNKDEHSLISNRGGTSAQQMVPVLRPERTGLAVSVLPALRAFIVTVLSSDNSDAELASLQGTAWWASRMASFGFRMRFVFPVGHPFPLVVSQYFIRVRLYAQPLSEPDVRR